MPKRWILKPLFPVFLFLILVSLLHWQLKLSLLFFWLGAFLGSFLLSLDQVIYCYFQAPHEFTSQRIRRLLQLKRYQEALMLLSQTGEERSKLVFHSVFFQVILLVVSFFVLTSSASLLGKGLVMGIFFQSLLEQGKDFKKKGQIDGWFWQFQGPPEKNLQVFYFVFMVLVFLSFVLFLI